jgi:hypothetical protein
MAGNSFQGQRVSLVFEQVNQYGIGSVEFNATILGPFHHLSLAIMVSFSTSPPRSHATRIHNIIYIHRPFIQRSIKLNIHIFEFAIFLGQYSYFYKLGETGCYILCHSVRAGETMAFQQVIDMTQVEAPSSTIV